MKFALPAWLASTVICSALFAADPAIAPIEPLHIAGEQFENGAQNPVRFWGVNLVALYPEHAISDALAKNLAALQINLVRPHHNLRPSSDWNPKMLSGALLTYKEDSRHFDPDALDRFDYLNAALRKNGIYLSFSLNWTRRYLPADADILKTTDADRDAWQAAMKELNSWSWQKSFDVYKMLPVIDERAAKLNEEFARNLLSHVNPYTGLAYGKDPQVLTIEMLNEASTEYAIVCGNHFPDYWQKQLEQRWQAYAEKAGVPAGDLYKPVGPARALRSKFLAELDEAYFERMKRVIQDAGCNTPLMFSNLWRGDNALATQSRVADVVENHIYKSPLVVETKDDFISQLAKNALADKPFFVGELNQSENAAAAKREAPFRTMLPLAAAAYGSLQNWSGIEWFAWIHGGRELNADGRAAETRQPNLGQMITDGMMIDHLRTIGILFRRGLVSPSSQPTTIHVDAPFTSADYNGLMRGKYVPQAGWQNVHAIRKAFGTAPASQASADWLTQKIGSPIVSDTGEISKDLTRQQLTIAAPMAEAFSGKFDQAKIDRLKTLELSGSGFATVVLVADDQLAFPASHSLIISRTGIDTAGTETDGPAITLHNLQNKGGHWETHITRTRTPGEALPTPTKTDLNSAGDLALPAGGWTECELHFVQ